MGTFINKRGFSTKLGTRQGTHMSDLSVYNKCGRIVIEIESMLGDKWRTTLEPRELDDLILYLSKRRSKYNAKKN